MAGAKFTLAWSLFAFSSAKASAGPTTVKLLDVLGATTGQTCTIFLKGDGTPDVDLTTSGSGGIGNQCVGGARTFCTNTNTSCTLAGRANGANGVYDATGHGNNCGLIIHTVTIAFDQPSAGKIAIDTGVVLHETNWCTSVNTFQSATGDASLAVFGEQTGGAPGFIGYAVAIDEVDAGDTIEMGSLSGTWRLDIGSTPGIQATAAINAWHAATGIINGVKNGSIINIDGAETAGGPLPGYPATFLGRSAGFVNTNNILGGGSHTYVTFGGYADNVQWTQAQRQAICHALYTIEGQITPGTNC